MESQLGGHPSYVLCSILKAKILLDEGLRWRVSDEQDIRLWHDRWIPIPHKELVHACDLRVVELTDSPRGGWKVEAIKHIFNERDSKQFWVYPLPYLFQATEGFGITQKIADLLFDLVTT